MKIQKRTSSVYQKWIYIPPPRRWWSDRELLSLFPDLLIRSISMARGSLCPPIMQNMVWWKEPLRRNSVSICGRLGRFASFQNRYVANFSMASAKTHFSCLRPSLFSLSESIRCPWRTESLPGSLSKSYYTPTCQPPDSTTQMRIEWWLPFPSHHAPRVRCH